MARGGYTLVEVLIAVTIVLLLAALAMPALTDALALAREVECASNLRQIGRAIRLHAKDHDGWLFPLRRDDPDGVLWYFGLEPTGSGALGEGARILDRTRAVLYPYLEAPETIETCPSVPFGGPYKPKFAGRGWTYGINYFLCSHHGYGNLRWIRTQDASRTLILADAAQVNTFQAPASPSNPMVEDWYYVEPGRRFVQFRHGGRANVLFADGHVGAVEPLAGSFDPRMPEAMIGQVDETRVRLKPHHWDISECRP